MQNESSSYHNQKRKLNEAYRFTAEYAVEEEGRVKENLISWRREATTTERRRFHKGEVQISMLQTVKKKKERRLVSLQRFGLKGTKSLLMFKGQLKGPDDDGRVLVKEHDIKLRWKIRAISKDEVKSALRKIWRAKAVSPDNIPIKVWKCLGDGGVQWLATLFNSIFKTGRMPDQWRSSVIVPLYKNKGDAQCCGNYRGINQQFGFMPGRSTTEAIHILKQLMEKYRENRRDLHMVFINLEKAYDCVPCQLIWDSLEGLGVPGKYIDIIRDMYARTVTCVRSLEIIPWCMLFTDDIMLVAESKHGLNEKLEEWRVALDSKGLRISCSKMKYMRCDFSGAIDVDNAQITVDS
ncbi:hypothetical protein SSX86_011598 [Deinandra increscens subsp. villosa]|uniref:Reverse transcriptase domain-containing protein n=1 Tax=Deinandra increscens subsp. villosa TaxID=3103831 RepID=A0AAP0D7B2_9ASTR